MIAAPGATMLGYVTAVERPHEVEPRLLMLKIVSLLVVAPTANADGLLAGLELVFMFGP